MRTANSLIPLHLWASSTISEYSLRWSQCIIHIHITNLRSLLHITILPHDFGIGYNKYTVSDYYLDWHWKENNYHLIHICSNNLAASSVLKPRDCEGSSRLKQMKIGLLSSRTNRTQISYSLLFIRSIQCLFSPSITISARNPIPSR